MERAPRYLCRGGKGSSPFEQDDVRRAGHITLNVTPYAPQSLH